MICCLQLLLNFQYISLHMNCVSYFICFHKCMQHCDIKFHIKLKWTLDINKGERTIQYISCIGSKTSKNHEGKWNKNILFIIIVQDISWVENCQVFLFLAYTLLHLCLYFVQQNENELHFMLSFFRPKCVRLWTSIQFICPLQHSSFIYIRR